MAFEFIHCGDLHLGCAPNRMEARFHDFFKVFLDVVTYAIKYNVKTILVSGDFFHLKNINAKTLQHTLEILQIAKENNIETIVIEGNHDKAFYVDETSWLYFLNEQQYITLLESDIVDGKINITPYKNKKGAIIWRDGVRIIGLGYLGGATEKYIKDLPNVLEPTKAFTILMMHAAIDRLSGQDMGDVKSNTIEQLKPFVDYVALGHIHNQYEALDFCYNPGTLENIRLKDGRTSEKKGFYHVIVNEKEKEVTYIQSQPRPIKFVAIDVSEAIKPQDIENILLIHDYQVKADEMLYLSLYGKVDFNQYLINFTQIQETLMEKYHLLHMEISNHINASSETSEEIEILDTRTMVLSLLKDNIKFQLPHIKSPEKVAKTMHDVIDLLNDGAEPSVIVSSLLKQDVKL